MESSGNEQFVSMEVLELGSSGYWDFVSLRVQEMGSS